MKKKMSPKIILTPVVMFICIFIAVIFAFHKNVTTEKSLTVHFKWSQSTPYLYYDTVEGENSIACAYPGVPMTNEENGWYSCTISDVESAKITINVPDAGYATIAEEKKSGEWWLDRGLWYSNNPDKVMTAEKETAAPQGISLANVKKASQDTVTVHMYSGSGVPNIYYWNALPVDKETVWPGEAMNAEENGWYTYQFSNCSKINLLFLVNGQQSEEFTRTTGEWWYDGTSWTNKDPNGNIPTATPQQSSGPIITPAPSENNDFREESIYFVITTRFYDGDSSNNVHCEHDKEAGNGDNDPAWRGDFKGLIEKLDYIKALGFSAVWITPVVENASGYDYHGYHALNFSKVDPRYESSDTSYQDLINAAHKRGIKIIQDIVLNHTSQYGENGLCKLFTQNYVLDKGASGNSVTKVRADGGILDEKMAEASKEVGGCNPSSSYDNVTGEKAAYAQYISRVKAIKDGKIYRDGETCGRVNWETFEATTCQIADDCQEINTENPKVYKYLIDAYEKYMDMGVDAFRIDTVKHVSRLTFNNTFLPAFASYAKKLGKDNFYMFGEVCTRAPEIFNRGNARVSPFYYTWKEEKTYAWNDSSQDGKDNLVLCKEAYDKSISQQSDFTDNSYGISNNEMLNGNEYHTPDYKNNSGMGVIDYAMHINFTYAKKAFDVALSEDKYFNDSTYNVVYIDSHDYGPNVEGRDDGGRDKWRYDGGTTAWAENLCLMFTFRGIPCLYYGSEIEFMAGAKIDDYNNPLSKSGRAYFGDNIEGTVNATDFGVYSGATGTMADTLNKPLAKQLQRLNLIRRNVPALQKGQYSVKDVEGGMAFKRRYTDSATDSFVCVAITDAATFKNIPNGTYQDVVTGKIVEVTNGTLSIEATGKGNMRAYVLNTSKTKAPGKIGEDGTYLK